MSARVESDLARFANQTELIVLPGVNATDVQPTDFSHGASLISASHEAAAEMPRASSSLLAAA